MHFKGVLHLENKSSCKLVSHSIKSGMTFLQIGGLTVFPHGGKEMETSRY